MFSRISFLASIIFSLSLTIGCGGEFDVNQSPSRVLEGEPVEVEIIATSPFRYSFDFLDVTPNPGFIFNFDGNEATATLEFIADPNIEYTAEAILKRGSTIENVAEPLNIKYLYRYNEVASYGQGLHIRLPSKAPSAEGYPTIIFIHGGAWNSESYTYFKTHWYDATRRGYAVIAIDYRLTNAHNKYNDVTAEDVRWPAQVQDTRCVLNWVAENADKFKLNVDQVAAVGYSAGGQMALMMGLVDSADHHDKFNAPCSYNKDIPELKAVSVFSAPWDLAYTYNSTSNKTTVKAGIEDLLNMDPAADNFNADQFNQLLQEASPIEYFDENTALPILAFHGYWDTWVRIENHNEIFQEQLDQLHPDGDYPYHLVIAQNNYHEMKNIYNWGRVQYLNFFDRHVKGDTSAPEVTCTSYPACEE